MRLVIAIERWCAGTDIHRDETCSVGISIVENPTCDYKYR